MKLRVILIISMILPANAVFVHRLCVQCGCSNSVNETEFFVSLNQNEVLFGDFKAQKQINRLPLFVSQISVPDLYDEAVGCKDICLQKIPNVIAAAGSPAEVRVNWTRNGVSVTEGVYISQYALNNDGTFNSFSTLTSTPRVGDEYSCTVEHEALDSPQIRTWDESVEPPSETPSETPTVVLAVGIVVGILGLATGMFFVIKASCFR
ncbi:mamu class II histocompatibility antigen, DR alpha chain-like isoform X2 [Hemibagrus wyckioides]|uniref:mamu class II histocompatibility antigen, DR alpha chain-like isoform X2 n=1 Tax=Hemibagrus wyckioides TaxID=337641 RepID=UPI00266BFAC4|nr:mamu class II histocompatibility antigen, DR alpha chain-like isoform X2 [Hemibagrus wyckioides]